jgi:hypothetical protein
MSKRVLTTVVVFLALFLAFSPAYAQREQYRRLRMDDYVDKMMGGWIGQMAGVGWGGPTEGDFMNKIMPEDAVPEWTPETVNQFGQDDLYVDMTFVRTLELYGLNVSIRQAGIDFANSGYWLWHANSEGRSLLREGIAPPDSGHPQFNKHADDIDYQIEADFAGLIAPGMPNLAVELGEKFGRLMNYGDGVYGGQFMGAMYAEAFFEDDPEKLVEAGLAHIPEGSQYHECMSDVLKWYRQYPDDWQKTWKLVSEKYHSTEAYGRFRCVDDLRQFNIDAKFNGAWVVVGMLYGKGDLDKTIVISMRCGEDSDCNPSSAAGVLFTTVGFRGLPEKFTSGLDREGVFSHTTYNFPRLIEVSQQLVRQAVLRAGGRIEKDEDGNEVLVIPVESPRPSKLEQSWDPGPIANSKFTEGEMRMINWPPMEKAVSQVLPGWSIRGWGFASSPGLYPELAGKKNVLVTTPKDWGRGCVLSKKVSIPAGKTTTLSFSAGSQLWSGSTVTVKADGTELKTARVNRNTMDEQGWVNVDVDLSAYAGKEIVLDLVGRGVTFWHSIELTSS